eukprot:g4171.t1
MLCRMFKSLPVTKLTAKRQIKIEKNVVRKSSKRKLKRQKRFKKKQASSTFVDIWGLARKGHVRDVLSLLDIRPRRIPIDAIDRSKFGQDRTLLIIAAAHSMNALLYELLLRDAEVNIRDRFGRSAIFYAARIGNKKGVELLIAFGAKTRIKDLKKVGIHQYTKKEAESGNLKAAISHRFEVDTILR